MSRNATGVYGGQSAQERRDERRAQLIEAGLQLYGTVGAPGTTVRGVCREAKLTSRFFYESFSDLEQLAVAVFDRVVGEATETVVAAVAAAPTEPAAQSHAAIDAFVRSLTDDPRRARVAFVEGLGSEALMTRRMETMSAFAELAAAQARATYGPPASDDPLVQLTARLLTGGLAELLIAWLDGGIEMSREQLIEDCAALFTATAESAAKLALERS